MSKKKNILIIGNDQIDSFSSILKLIEENDCRVVNVYDNEWDVEELKARIKAIQTPQNIIEINGVEYVQRKKEAYRAPGKLASLLSVTSLFGGVPNVGPKTPDLPSGTNLISEYTLIQQKKSKLSRRKRDYIEHLFRCQYITLKEFKEKTK